MTNERIRFTNRHRSSSILALQGGAMRLTVIGLFLLVLASLSTACFCPLWDQGCGGKIETEGVDYIKYVGVVRDAETGKSLPGISGAIVTYHFNAVKKVPDQDVDVQTNPDGTFTLL